MHKVWGGNQYPGSQPPLVSGDPERAARVECKPTPPKHEQADQGIRRAAHRGRPLNIPTA